MLEYRNALSSAKLFRVLAAILVGLGVGTLLSPEPVSVPVVGTISGLVVGGVGLVVGPTLYLAVPKLVGPDCGCAGDCGCA